LNSLNKVAKELGYVGIIFLVTLVIFKIIFHKENISIVLRTVFGLYYTLILPGFMLMYYWFEKLDFLERLIIGFPVSAAIIGIFSYYLGIVGIHTKFHIFILPPIMIIAGAVIIKKISVRAGSLE
jgi:uncharacterized membrane protein